MVPLRKGCLIEVLHGEINRKRFGVVEHKYWKLDQIQIIVQDFVKIL